MDAKALFVDHADLGHGLGQTLVAVALWRALATGVLVWLAVKKTTQVDHAHQPRRLFHHNAPALRVILMRQAVVQALQQHRVGVVAR